MKEQELLARIKTLEAEKLQAENMLEYERNKFEKQMRDKEAGIIEELYDKLELELLAIKETAEYIDDDNKRRIMRRLQRIDDILQSIK